MVVDVLVERDLGDWKSCINFYFNRITGSVGGDESVKYRSSLFPTEAGIYYILLHQPEIYKEMKPKDTGVNLLKEIKARGDSPRIVTHSSFPEIIREWLTRYYPGESLVV